MAQEGVVARAELRAVGDVFGKEGGLEQGGNIGQGEVVGGSEIVGPVNDAAAHLVGPPGINWP